MTQPYLRKTMRYRGLLSALLTGLIHCVLISPVSAQRAIRIDPDYYNGEMIITDTLVPAEMAITLYSNRAEAMANLLDPVPYDSLPELKTWLYRTGDKEKFPVLLISKREHWMMIPLREFTGYGIPVIHQVLLKHKEMVLIEAETSERFFTSTEYPSGFQARKGLIIMIDIITGRKHLQQESNLKIEQGTWSKGPEGNTATSYEQTLELTFKKQIMQLKVSSEKLHYTTQAGIEKKSQQVSLEYEFVKDAWLRRKAVMIGF